MSQKCDLWVTRLWLGARLFLGFLTESHHLLQRPCEIQRVQTLHAGYRNDPPASLTCKLTYRRPGLLTHEYRRGQVGFAVRAKRIEFVPLQPELIGIFWFSSKGFEFGFTVLQFSSEVQDVWN